MRVSHKYHFDHDLSGRRKLIEKKSLIFKRHWIPQIKWNDIMNTFETLSSLFLRNSKIKWFEIKLFFIIISRIF
jgi:hypothetical protein